MQFGTERLRSIYLCFQSLWALEQAPLHGRFVLLRGGEAQAAAARIAGAASLLMAGDPGEARLALRTGAVDFLVTSLEEALRILKNDLRRKSPVGVCLRAPEAEALRACVDRGVQPDYLGAPEAALEARGARRIAWRLEPEKREREARDDAARDHWLRWAPATLGRADAGRVRLPLDLGKAMPEPS